MNLEEVEHEKQVERLRTVLRSEKGTLPGFLALFALRHHAIMGHKPELSLRPSLRWYLGQLAKEYIRRYYAEAKETMESFEAIGLVEARDGEQEGQKEFVLREALVPALREVLEEVFGKETVEDTVAKAKFYKEPAYGPERGRAAAKAGRSGE